MQLAMDLINDSFTISNKELLEKLKNNLNINDIVIDSYGFIMSYDLIPGYKTYGWVSTDKRLDSKTISILETIIKLEKLLQE